MANKMVYFFGGGKGEGNAKMKNLLGGKGANLHEMCKMGLSVPPGFTITRLALRSSIASGLRVVSLHTLDPSPS